MRKHTILKPIRFVSFVLFLLTFVASVIFFIFLSKKSNTNDQFTPQLPQPSKYDSYPTVIIDAGHGGEDGGAIGIDGTLEKDLNLAIALELEEMLRAEGIKTRLTRDTDILLYDRNSNFQGHKKSQDMAARLAISEEYENAVFISIHMNSFSQSKYKGLQVYYSTNSPLSAELAQIIQQSVTKNLQSDNQRKIKPSQSGIYLLENITHPTVLIECGFLSNSEDCKNLNSSDYRHRLCVTVFSAILSYFNNISQNKGNDS